MGLARRPCFFDKAIIGLMIYLGKVVDQVIDRAILTETNIAISFSILYL